jgi:nicotinamide phosphoribosyltransferase
MNLILDTDSYKLSHFAGYPADAEIVYSYAESRGGRYDELVFLGLQAFLMKYLSVPITQDNIEEAELFAKMHGEPFNREGWEHILNVHDGYLPLLIKAVPEGTVIPPHHIMASVENTDPKLPWLTSYIETALIRMWYPITVASRIHKMKKRIKPYYDRTSDEGFMGFSILDFSSRGVSSFESSQIGGLGHLASFSGSDNIPAVLFARKYYGAEMAALSVPATEHSIMTAFGQDNELESFKYLIEHMMPYGGILSVVSDTWNVYEAARKWASLAGHVRAKKGTLVVRPDSGDFREVLPTVLRILHQGFGYTTNKKGFHVLNDVKVLQGDGITEDTAHIPFEIAEDMGISADSIMTGSGGGLMSHDIDRDTSKFAFKASHVIRNGVGMDIAKNPITDPGKRSKMGRLALVGEDFDHYETVNIADSIMHEMFDILEPVYLNGKIVRYQTLDDIRQRLEASL